MKKFCLQIVRLALLLALGCSTSDGDNHIPDPDGEAQVDTNAEEDLDLLNTVVATHGQLSVSGKNLVDKDGNAIQLKGMSLSWTKWWPQFYTKEVVRWLKEDWNVTVVRGLMGVEDAEGYLDDKALHKALIITVIEAAIEEGIYELVDWLSHHAEDHLEEAKAFF